MVGHCGRKSKGEMALRAASEPEVRSQRVDCGWKAVRHKMKSGLLQKGNRALSARGKDFVASDLKADFVAEMNGRYGPLFKLARTQSLYELGKGVCRVYVRYSKLHSGRQTFFGLRREDLRQLEGHKAFISFLWDGQREPLLIPFAEFEEVFAESQPASDGQYKVQVYPRDDAAILYIARTGRFNVEGYFGWLHLEEAMKGFHPHPALSHPQIQTLLGAIGTAKDYDVWVPVNDRAGLDWSLTSPFRLVDELPPGFEAVQSIVQEIDVIWVRTPNPRHSPAEAHPRALETAEGAASPLALVRRPAPRRPGQPPRTDLLTAPPT